MIDLELFMITEQHMDALPAKWRDFVAVPTHFCVCADGRFKVWPTPPSDMQMRLFAVVDVP